ncbi:hypothetical protein [Rhodococcoides fascians]|uniref:hypothetical protein n=1 Tax=Rhodococcoides fascians TaxID=1828 RepID=UPI0012D2A242|nr:hypothetical protein [Rhodococcus fascians]
MNWIPVGVAVFGIAVTVTLYVLQRRGQRRNRLAVTVTSQKLFVASSGLPAKDLSVEYNGQSVADPHLVNVSVENHGPKDISTSDFDQKVPITVELNAVVIGGGDSVDGPNALLVKVSKSVTSVDIEPALLAEGSRHIFTIVVDGSPKPSVTGAILNCDLTMETTPSTTREPLLTRHIYTISLIAAAAATLGTLLYFPLSENRSAESQTELREAVTEAVVQYEQTIDDQGAQLREQTARLDEQAALIETLVKQLAPQPTP